MHENSVCSLQRDVVPPRGQGYPDICHSQGGAVIGSISDVGDLKSFFLLSSDVRLLVSGHHGGFCFPDHQRLGHQSAGCFLIPR